MVSFPHPPHPPQPEPELPPTHPNNSNGSGGSLPRAQSNLDILSQTAAVVIEESISSSSAHSSPYAAVRVFSPPAEDKNNNTSRLLALPEIVAANATSHPQQPQQPHRLVFLQQKRGFLPPALPYERSASSMLVGSEVVIDNNNGCIEIPCDYSTAGIFMSHSNSSFNSNSNSAAIRASMSSPAEDQLQQHHHPSGFPTSDMSSSHRSVATTPTGGAGNHLAAANNNDAAVQSFLLANVNSFSSHSSSGGGHTNGMGRPLFLTDPQQQQPLSMPTAFVPPRPALHHLHYRPTGGAMVETTTVPLHASTASADDGQILVRENLQLRLQLSTRDMTIEMLQAQVDSLQQEIRQLRQLPTGKISQIPLEYVYSFNITVASVLQLVLSPLSCAATLLNVITEICFPSCESTARKFQRRQCLPASRLFRRLPWFVNSADGIQPFSSGSSTWKANGSPNWAKLEKFNAATKPVGKPLLLNARRKNLQLARPRMKRSTITMRAMTRALVPLLLNRHAQLARGSEKGGSTGGQERRTLTTGG